MTTPEWQPTQSIRMAIQSAELSLIGLKARPQLQIACSLVNIARGHCTAIISPLPQDSISASGRLHISVDRPVMQLDVGLARPAFDRLSTALTQALPRPASLIVTLHETLMVNISGDLRIEKPLECDIADLSWVFPIQ